LVNPPSLCTEHRQVCLGGSASPHAGFVAAFLTRGFPSRLVGISLSSPVCSLWTTTFPTRRMGFGGWSPAAGHSVSPGLRYCSLLSGHFLYVIFALKGPSFSRLHFEGPCPPPPCRRPFSWSLPFQLAHLRVSFGRCPSSEANVLSSHRWSALQISSLLELQLAFPPRSVLIPSWCIRESSFIPLLSPVSLLSCPVGESSVFVELSPTDFCFLTSNSP